MVIEADSIVADAQSQLWRPDVLQLLYVTFSSSKIAGDGVQDAERRGLRDGAQIGLGLVGPGDAILTHLLSGLLRVGFERCAPHSLKVLRCQAELTQDVLIRDGLMIL